ncbi:MAG: YitT family protein [Candidatus Coproplasma sp.]
MKNEKFLKTAGYWFILNLGTLLLAAGVYFFKAPNHFATGGVSGIAIILANFLPLKQSHIVLIINALLLVVGFIFLGRGCTFKTIYCSLVYSLENLLFEYVLPLEGPLTAQPILELVYAILLTGIGSAIIFNCGASSGGTDIIALILKKFTKLNVGRALLITDCIIAASTFFIFGTEAGLFSMLGLFAKAFVIDGVIEDIGKSRYITVITTVPEEIGKYIIEVMKRDYTSYKATGGYTGNEKTVLITVCKRSEALKLKHKVKEIDAASFVIITDATEILGKGFRGVS